ncbi:MAG: C25 family cysteine peptidase [Bacteroidales bacterium]|nr:C25 family cysteine peptidase [Bacteroidales bacterium]MDD4217940.1 C25 family cysteine peptidase [Bacteroidales bacterium]
MKKTTLLLLFVMVSYVIFAQSQVILNSTKTKAEIVQNSDQKLVFTNDIEGFYVDGVKTKDGMYSRIIIPEYFPDNNISYPELPVMTKLIEVPHDAEFEINIISYNEQIIDLNEYGAEFSLVPNQPSMSKSQDPANVPFEKNASIYTDKEYYQTELVKVENISKMRGVQVAQLTVSPFSYDIESNVLTIKNNIQVEVVFKNGDMSKSASLKANKYSPAFAAAYNKLWNYKAPMSKDALSQYPIKYVIISHRMFEDALAPFVKWKTKKGFYVDVQYTDVIGTTTDAIHTYLQGLYDAGTTENPAPTYLLIVGDVAQVPTFSGSGHKTDMYYCEFDGGDDYIPEMYFGRFSATTVAQLQPQIDKTLMFEQYTFPDPSFLAEVVLVAGNDNTWAPTHGNGQVNYAHNYYFNAEHNVVDNIYLHPASNSLASEIIGKISDGVGFVSYTAHCNSNGWGGPSFTTSDIPGLQNENEYFFSVGNCCLSNKFDDAECFGEALLRAEGKGAVIHLGGSNSTYWDEDFYWSVGITSSINAEPTYEGTTQATYDHLFHENDEDPYFTAGQMNYMGNLAVNESTSTRKKYYWEIYHVMGDPSLMPYVGVPDEVAATYLSTLPIGMSSLTVNTEEMAYVAISINGELLDAKLSDQSGVVTLEFEPLTMVVNADIVVTKQFRAPHIGTIMVIPNDNEYDAMLQTINVPAAMIHVTESTLSPQFTILNLGQINLTSLTVGYSINGGAAVEENWTGDLATLESEILTFPEISLTPGQNVIVAYVNSPNGQTDEYPDNDQQTKNVLVYAGNAKLMEAVTPENILCNTTTFIPEIVLKNFDTFPLTSAIISYECGAITDELNWIGELTQNQTVNIVFPENTFPAGNNTIIYSIESINGGSNLATTGNSLSVDFMVVASGEKYELDLLTDRSGDETTWELVDDATSNVLYSGGPYPSGWGSEAHYITEFCLGPGCYTFTIFDSYGDGMSPQWFGNKGRVTITNISTQTVVYELAGDGFTTQASFEFCIEMIHCPDDITIDIADEPFELTGGIPVGGNYTGIGVTDNIFESSVAGVGSHTITYHYVFEASEEMICEFEINVTATAIISNHTENLSLYPNPTNGLVNIDFENAQYRNIEVLNLCGQIVKTVNSDTDKIEIDLAGLAEGTYILKVKSVKAVSLLKISLVK